MASHLRVINADATPDEVAAIVAALAVLRAVPVEPAADDTLREWVRTARLQARRAGLQRGPWRLSGRVARHTRA
jgi:hypothetical protein